MRTYIDISFNENSKPEYSIHGLDENMIRDIVVAAELLKYMLLHKLELQAFNGACLNENSEIRVNALSDLIRKTKKLLKNDTEIQN